MDLKKDIERLLVFLIPAVVLQAAFQATVVTVVADIMDGDSEGGVWKLSGALGITVGEAMSLLSLSGIIGPLFPMLVIAGWCWFMEKRDGGRPVLWAFGGIVLNYWGLLLYLAQRIWRSVEIRTGEV